MRCRTENYLEAGTLVGQNLATRGDRNLKFWFNIFSGDADCLQSLKKIHDIDFLRVADLIKNDQKCK